MVVGWPLAPSKRKGRRPVLRADGRLRQERELTARHPAGIEGEARVLVLLDQPLISEVVRLILNHGDYMTRDARDAREATTILAEWQPHLAIIDMDLGVAELLDRLGRQQPEPPR